MAGKASVSFDKYRKVFKELTALHKKDPTVIELQKALGPVRGPGAGWGPPLHVRARQRGNVDFPP